MLGRLHVLTDYLFQQTHSHAALARFALEGGADVIQFRHKGVGIRHLVHGADAVRSICDEHGGTLLINDRADVALAVGADGLHVGQEDLPVAIARRLLPDASIIGATATTVEQALEAEAAGASYIGFGPVFPTRSKANPASVKGLRGLERVVEVVQIPVIAIAGITPARVQPVIQAGAYGIAVMSAVTTADHPQRATRAFRRALDRAVVDMQ